MALGQNYNNNNDKKNTGRELYGDIKFYHPEAEIDPGALSYSFWNGMIKITISPVDKTTANSSHVKYDHQNAGVIYLRPMYAYMLAQEIKNVIDGHPHLNNGIQNLSNDAVIFVCSGSEFGVASPCLAIRKIDENGNIVSTYVYQFNTNYYAIRNFDSETKDFEKYFYENLEMITFMQTLEDFARSMNGAYAFANSHYGRFDTSRTHTKLDSIAEKLGITYPSDNKGGYVKKQSSIFDNKETRTTHFEMADPTDFDM